MKIKHLLWSVLILCSALLTGNANAENRFDVDVSSAGLYLDMARGAIDGQLPDSTAWDSLFNSNAYKALLDNIHWDKEEFKRNVRCAFDIVYNPSNAAKCDSIANILNDITTVEDELPFFVSTALSIKNNIDRYESILSTIDINSVIEAADSMAVELLPNQGKGLEPQISPIYFIVWDLECRALSQGIFLDLNTFFYDGLQTATEGLAHELHHFYLGPVFETVYDKDVKDAAVLALGDNMREGVADIINKKKMPLESLAPYGDSMLKIYNADYNDSPDVLKELDEITCSYLDGQLSTEDYYRKAPACAHFGGHTTGDFMVFLIRDQLGIDAVVECVGDLDAFIDNYNKAAKKAGTYVFSDKFTNHIHAVSNASKRKS